jgi:hypothetical protein
MMIKIAMWSAQKECCEASVFDRLSNELKTHKQGITRTRLLKTISNFSAGLNFAAMEKEEGRNKAVLVRHLVRP